MKTNLSTDQVFKIAQDYKEQYKLSGIINNSLERTIKVYDGFDGVKGVAWLVLVSIIPTIYEADDEYTIIISDEKEKVEYIIDPNGHYYSPHLTGSSGITDKEFDAIWDDDDI
ncbi:hypothetical protein [Metabacillus fastidiosus]|uniref:hypothetical protein n=1 Tax=Metabacillus fastidiosus TaxID=1458 RepID=UPI002DB96B96|nr:hypothetical protein [Metabacillus fastidiosus]MEC2077211.1 hypothetical protein [Metabacillus fastidiosus]